MISDDVGTASLPMIIEGNVQRLSADCTVVVIAENWPSWLVMVIALDIPMRAAYFPPAYHCYFKPKNEVSQWMIVKDLVSSPVDQSITYLVSGSLTFVRKLTTWFGDMGLSRSIVSIEFPRRDVARAVSSKNRYMSKRFCDDNGLQHAVLADQDYGGATDAVFTFGFGSAITPTPLPDLGLPVCVRHFLDGGVDTEGRSVRIIPRSMISMDDIPKRTVLWDKDVVRAEGLFPTKNPCAKVYCPAHHLPHSWIVRSLTLHELLGVYQLPASMDDIFEKMIGVSYKSRRGDHQMILPFENASSPSILASIARKLWGVVGGVERSCNLTGVNSPMRSPAAENGDSADAIESHNVAKVEEEKEEEEEEVKRSRDGCGVHPNSIMTIVKRSDTLMGVEATNLHDEDEVEEVEASISGDGAVEDVDASISGDGAVVVQVDLGDEFPAWRGSAQWSDDDSGSSLASAETMRWQHARCLDCSRWDKYDPEAEMERDTREPQFNPGPPFAIGDIVICDVLEWCANKRRGLVTQADHPNYVIYLDNGITVDTEETDVILFPSYADSNEEFAPYMEPDIFTERRSTLTQVGSFGVHIDTQNTALQRVEEAKAYAKAVKADDARIPVELWNDRIKVCGVSSEAIGSALAALRKLAWRWYIKVLVRDCVRFMKEQHGDDWVAKPRHAEEGITELGRDQKAITEMLWHSAQSDWFEYRAGSKVVHFRFPKRYRKLARDGVPIFFEQPGPTTKGSQAHIADPGVREQVREKVAKALQRRYLYSPSFPIKSHINYFAVPKGEDDIRLVYDATANGLNDCVWSPSFWLPTINTLVRGVDKDSFMTDRDIGDMFLNFQLHASAIPYTGVDLSMLYDSPDEVGMRSAVWDRNLMGFAPSPYNCIKTALIVEEIVKGDRWQTGLGSDGRELNPFQWASVRWNLPGSHDYDPAMSWLAKLRLDGRVACNAYTFVDDERVTGPDKELTWQASHVLASRQAYVGLQDAARKVRPCSQSPGAWAGSVVHISPELGVCVLTSRDKWSKMKRILNKWSKVLASSEPQLSHKELLSDRGFLVYVTRTYPAMVPYLKGFHLTIEMWRGGRDMEGWKLKESDEDSVGSSNSLETVDDSDLDTVNRRMQSPARLYAPEDGFTRPAPRLGEDIAALLKLSDFELPPLRVVRPSQVVHVYYGFGDASGKQYGATISDNYNRRSQLSPEVKDHNGVRFRIGLWSSKEEEESSNYKELINLVNTVSSEARAGRLNNCEFFLFTDNSTAESCFYKGTSKSKLLHSLVLSLRMLEMEYGMSIYIVHISGTRMIAQGTDGCSRGSLMEGVMTGTDMLAFVDLSRSAIDRHPPLLDWVRGWTSRATLTPLSPEGWFDEGHGIVGGSMDHNGVWMPTYGKGGRMFLWTPPPAIADVALEEILMARHKRTDTFHVILVPRIMTPRWRRLFYKACDFSFVVSPGCAHWPSTMFEPLWVGILLPFVKHRPWCLKRAPLLLEIGRELRGVLETGEGDAGAILRKLTLLPKRVDALPFHLACGVLHMPGAGPSEIPSG